MKSNSPWSPGGAGGDGDGDGDGDGGGRGLRVMDKAKIVDA